MSGRLINTVKVTDILLKNGQNDRFWALSQVLGSVMSSGLVQRASNASADTRKRALEQFIDNITQKCRKSNGYFVQNGRFLALSQVLGGVMSSGLVQGGSCGARAARGACERSEASLSEAKAETLRAKRSSSERSEGRCTASLPLQSEGAERSEVPERPPEGASTTLHHPKGPAERAQRAEQGCERSEASGDR